MALGTVDERGLLIPIAEGIFEVPLWESFLRRLLARTGARQVCLLVRWSGNAAAAPLLRTVSKLSAATHPDIDALTALGLLPLALLRPGRVYALAEMLSPDRGALREKQATLLKMAEIADARFVRVNSTGEHHAWLLLLNDRETFGAADSILLSALAPHLAAAIATLAALDNWRLRATVAEQALGLLGVGEAIFDCEGRVLAADRIASEALAIAADGRPSLPARSAAALAAACAEIAGRPASARRLAVGTADDGATHARAVLLRPAPPGTNALPTPAAAVGAVRPAIRTGPRSGATVIARTLGLSDREAALAEAISNGASIIEAGAALKLTAETARNYTKRIYAKTGAKGQADLVRIVLTGLAPLA